MAAAAAAAWKANLEQRAVSVDDNTKYALGHLVAAFIHLEHRIDTAAAAEGAARDQIEAALESLGLAAGAASLASAQILAAEVIGLRGASTNPARPLGLIEEIPDTSIRSGLLALKAAYPIADELFHQLKVGKVGTCYLRR